MPWPLLDAAIVCAPENAPWEWLKVGHDKSFICWARQQKLVMTWLSVFTENQKAALLSSRALRLYTAAFEHLLLPFLHIGLVQNGHAGPWTAQGDIQEPENTRYNPLDLFSGDLTRAQHAIMTMLQTPARNLRLFSDGKRIANGAVRSFMADWLGLPPVEAISTASGIIAGALHKTGAHMHRPPTLWLFRVFDLCHHSS